MTRQPILEMQSKHRLGGAVKHEVPRTEFPSKTSNSVTILRSLTAMITDERPPGIAGRHRTAAPVPRRQQNPADQREPRRISNATTYENRSTPANDKGPPWSLSLPLRQFQQRVKERAELQTPEQRRKMTRRRVRIDSGESRSTECPEPTEFPQINDQTAHRSAERQVHMGLDGACTGY